MSQSKILKDASIPFQIKPWEYEEMKNSDEEINIRAFREVKKQYLGGTDYSTILEYNNRNLNHPIAYFFFVLIHYRGQPKAGTGLKMQTISVVFSTLHC